MRKELFVVYKIRNAVSVKRIFYLRFVRFYITDVHFYVSISSAVSHVLCNVDCNLRRFVVSRFRNAQSHLSVIWRFIFSVRADIREEFRGYCLHLQTKFLLVVYNFHLVFAKPRKPFYNPVGINALVRIVVSADKPYRQRQRVFGKPLDYVQFGRRKLVNIRAIKVGRRNLFGIFRYALGKCEKSRGRVAVFPFECGKIPVVNECDVVRLSFERRFCAI